MTVSMQRRNDPCIKSTQATVAQTVFQSVADFKVSWIWCYLGPQGRYIIAVNLSISGPSLPSSLTHQCYHLGSGKPQTFTDLKCQPLRGNSEIWANSFHACPTKARHKLTSQTSELRLRKDIFHFHGLEMYNLMSLWGILAGVTLKFDDSYGLRGRTNGGRARPTCPQESAMFKSYSSHILV